MSDPLTPEQLDELRILLQQERERTLRRAEVEVRGDGPEPMDVQEHASGEAHRRLLLSLSDRDRARLSEIEAALSRISAGTYGVCEETGEPISFARLKAEPTTRYTVEALEMLEDEDARDRVKQHGDLDDAY